MFKSVFAKYMVCFLIVFVACYIALFVILLGTVSTNERESSISHSSESVKVLVEGNYIKYLSNNDSATLNGFLNEQHDSLRIQLTGIADCTNTVLLITNEKGTVSVCSDGYSLRGKKVPGDIIASITNEAGVYTFSGNLGGMFPDNMYAEGIELATGDIHGFVFACTNSGDMSPFVRNTLGTMIWIGVLILMAGMIGCYFISDRITAPIVKMRKAAKKYAVGDFTARVQVYGNDEVSELAVTMNKMAESLSELDASKNSFISSVSHELRTPMATIIGFIDGILDGAIPPDKEKYYLGIVSNETRRLSRLVSSLLDISRIQAGDRKFNITEFDICETARQVLISNEKRIDDKKLDVTFECDEDNMFALGDIDSVHQIMYNITDNAIKFSYEKGKLDIKITHSGDKRIKVVIRNEGIGMSEDDVKHVFERFYKADKSRGLDKTGVGLGMYITKTIIEAMHGSISVDSVEGKWCRFTFYLPESGRIAVLAEDEPVDAD